MNRTRAGCRQRGFAVLALAVTIVMIAAGVVVGWSALTSRAQTAELAHAQRAYLAEVRAQLLAWYERELAVVDAAAAAPDPAQLLREAGIAPRWRLRVAMSDRLRRERVAHRVIAAWLPAEGDASLFDASSGQFTPSAGTPYVVVSGFDLQARAIAETRAGLDRLARQLEAAYRARHLADPSRDIGVNRFRAVRCPAPEPGEFPCIDDYTPIVATALPPLAGIEPRLARNAWGGPVEASNGVDASLSMPYSMALRTATPWGETLAIVAVAPL